MMEANGHESIEPTEAARDEWVELCRTIADMTLFSKADSWIFGANIPGKKNTVMFYMAGIGNYCSAINAVKEGGYQTMIFDRAAEERGLHSHALSKAGR